MPSTDIDFDRSSTELNLGIELEYPKRSPGDEKFSSRGENTRSEQESISSLPLRLEANPVYDGTVGLEVVSEQISPVDAENWYRDVVDYVEAEYNAMYEPVGILKNGNTAGAHIHISPLSEDQARRLYEISQQPWAKVLFCSTIANGEDGAAWPVFRGGRHCRMEFRGSRYACVNERRGDGHYEWRLPEPMSPEHMGIIAKFLYIFEADPDVAIQYAQELLDDGDERITAIKRAEAVGMDIDNVPSVTRAEAPDDPENFYSKVADSWHLPTIHRVRTEGTDYYILESEIEDTFKVSGIEFSDGDVLYADSLEHADSAESNRIWRAYQQRSENTRHTAATDELTKIIKKKKGKA